MLDRGADFAGGIPRIRREADARSDRPRMRARVHPRRGGVLATRICKRPWRLTRTCLWLALGLLPACCREPRRASPGNRRAVPFLPSAHDCHPTMATPY